VRRGAGETTWILLKAHRKPFYTKSEDAELDEGVIREKQEHNIV